MNIWAILGIMFVAALAACACGFKKFVWFLSIGYGFAVLACGLVIAVINVIGGTLNITGLIACILFVVYGIRLGGFLLIRELKNATYRKTLEEATKTDKKIPVFVLATIWLFCGALYVMQTSGVAFTMYIQNVTSFLQVNSVVEYVGVVVMLLGVLIEALSDKQKSAEKKVNPHKPAMHGLFKFCRCPNYYGEITFWTGVTVFSVPALIAGGKWWMWVFVVLAYICIVYIMFNGAKRLEKRQEAAYGGQEDFEAYIKKTPIIIWLFIPVKSLKNSKIVK